MAGSVQQQIGVQPAPGMEGAFSSANPIFSVVAGPGGLVTGASGATIGRWGWLANDVVDQDGAPVIVNCFGSGKPNGFIVGEMQGLNTTFLSGSTLGIPQGFPVTLIDGADGVWVKNTGSAMPLYGDKCYANMADGTSSFALAGATASTWSIASETATFSGTISGNILTAGTVTGTLYPGAVLTGGSVASGTKIGDQISGVAGAAGTYYVNIGEQALAATNLTATYGLLTLTTVASGNFGVGDTLTGASAGVTAGTYITAPITGTGGSGSTFAVTPGQTADQGAVGTLTGATNVDTGWVARSVGANGEIVKIGVPQM